MSSEGSLYQAFTSRGSRGVLILEAMRVSADVIFGDIAQCKGKRATAAKHYEQAISAAKTLILASSHPQPTSATVALIQWVRELKDTARRQYTGIVYEDIRTANYLHEPLIGCRVERSLRWGTIDSEGNVTFNHFFVFATNVCHSCKKRRVKMFKCARCKIITCQKPITRITHLTNNA